MKKINKKAWLAPLIVVAVAAAIYAGTWVKIYVQTNAYYEQALENHAAKKYGLALKGGTDFVTGEFAGSYAQVVNAWKSPYCFPKPKIYSESLAAMREIITQELSPEDIDAIFKKYFKVDNQYLNVLLTQKARLLAAAGDTAGADAVYAEIKDLFPLNNQSQEEINQFLEEHS